jgi:hypothetical protein
MKTSYLSVDLDFWCDHENAHSATRFINKVLNLNVPTIFVIEHEELLPDINRSKADILYNVDFHSDLCAKQELKPGEKPEDGTWANYVKWQSKGEFYWICPSLEKCYKENNGTCCGNPYLDPFKKKNEENTDWNKVTVTPKLSTINWNSIKQVGICLSPCFSCPDTIGGAARKLGMPKQDMIDLMVNQPLSIPQKRKRGILYKVA